MIDMNKKYRTQDGEKVRLLCTDRPGSDYPVVGLVGKDILAWDCEGNHIAGGRDLDLVELAAYEDFEIDEKVWAFNEGSRVWYPAHFSGVTGEGRPKTFSEGTTSFSGTTQRVWDECRKASEFTPGERG